MMIMDHVGHARIFSYSPTIKKWNQLGDAIVGESSVDQFGHSVSISADGMNIVVGAYCNDDNGENSGDAILFSYSPTANKLNQLGSALV